MAPAAAEIVDRRTVDDRQTRLPSHLTPADRAVGLAYDRNTDHLFVRIAPGDRIRVIERPSGRQFALIRLEGGAPAGLAADLAIRADDRHLFFLSESGGAIIETRLDGRAVRTDALPGDMSPAAGIAIDQRNNGILLLLRSPRGPVVVLNRERQEVSRFALRAEIAPTALAHDEATGHVYAPLRPGNAIGEFDRSGTLVREFSTAGSAPMIFVDAGQRAFVRLF